MKKSLDDIVAEILENPHNVDFSDELNKGYEVVEQARMVPPPSEIENDLYDLTDDERINVVNAYIRDYCHCNRPNYRFIKNVTYELEELALHIHDEISQLLMHHPMLRHCTRAIDSFDVNYIKKIIKPMVDSYQKSIEINNDLLKSMEILKGKKMPIGTVSGNYKKVAEGKWVPVSDGKEEAGERTAQEVEQRSQFKKGGIGSGRTNNYQMHTNDAKYANKEDRYLNRQSKKKTLTPEEKKKKLLNDKLKAIFDKINNK